MKLIIADDHIMVRKALEMLLNYQHDMEVVATAGDGQEAYLLVEQLHPDVVLLDISMPPGESGMITAGRMHDDKEYLLYTLQSGASGYVLKNAPEDELLEAIRTVHDGGVFISKEMVPYLVQSFVNRHEKNGSYLELSARELEVLTLIAKGYGNKEISDLLFISVKTVESYKAKIMTKLDLKTRSELVEYALKKKLLQ